jgi:hypothetical protein
MNPGRNTRSIRLILEILLVLAFILIRVAGRSPAQANPGLETSSHAPADNIAAAEILADIDPDTQAALMAAEMAALTPPFYMVDLPFVSR